MTTPPTDNIRAVRHRVQLRRVGGPQVDGTQVATFEAYDPNRSAPYANTLVSVSLPASTTGNTVTIETTNAHVRYVVIVGYRN